ncbi:unnamed protein product, partial [Brachionus calyciflorus]
SAGENGKPGLPGYSGGNLKIIYDNIYNENLIVISDGGQGGPGQDGGDGVDGQNGADALPHEVHSDCSLNEMYCTNVINSEAPRLPNRVIEALGGCNEDLLKSCYLTRIIVWEDNGVVKKSSRYHARNGSPGQAGGNSGKPGKGGNGGRSGQNKMMSVKSPTFKWWTSNIFGPVGVDGKPGIPGQGGKIGNGIERGFFIQQLRGIALAFTFGGGDVYEMAQESEVIPSYGWAISGSITRELNIEGIQFSKESPMDLYGSENLYMKFINDLSVKFINSRFNQQTFFINFKLKCLSA